MQTHLAYITLWMPVKMIGTVFMISRTQLWILALHATHQWHVTTIKQERHAAETTAASETANGKAWQIRLA